MRSRRGRYLRSFLAVIAVGLVVGCGTDHDAEIPACVDLREVTPMETSSDAVLNPADIVVAFAQRGEDLEPGVVVVIQRDGTVFALRKAELVRLAIGDADTRRVRDCVGSAAFTQLANAYNVGAEPERDPKLGRPGPMIARGPIAGDQKVVFVLQDCADTDGECFRKLPKAVQHLIKLKDALRTAAKSQGTVVGDLPRSPDLGVGYPTGQL